MAKQMTVPQEALEKGQNGTIDHLLSSILH
jgi:hypothetical protein